MKDIELNSTVFIGEQIAHRVANFLIARSAWFALEPLPCGQWEVQYKKESAASVAIAIGGESSRTERNRTMKYELYDDGGSTEDFEAADNEVASDCARTMLRNWWADQLQPGESVRATLVALDPDGERGPDGAEIEITI